MDEVVGFPEPDATPSGQGPDIGVDTIPNITPIDQSFLPPILGIDQGTNGINPDLPGPVFGVLISQGFPPSIL